MPHSVDTPARLRRTTLLLYAVIGPAFCASMAVLGRWREDPRPLAAVAALLAGGALWLVLRTSPRLLDWIFPVAIAPVACCAVGFVACGERGAAYLAVMGAPMAWAAALFELPVAVAAAAAAMASVFLALALRIGPSAAAASALLLSPVAGSVTWVVFATAKDLRAARRRWIAHAERARAALQAIPDVLVRADREGTFLEVYCAPGESLPVPKEQLLGRNFREFLPPAIAARVGAALEHVVRTGEVRTVEYTLSFADGPRSFESRFARCGEDEAVVLRRDMSQQRIAEQELRDSEERYRSIVAAAAEGIVMRHADGTISVFNPAAERLFGINVRQAQGLEPFEPGWYTIREDGTELSADDRPNRLVLQTGKPVSDATIGVHRPDGSVTWLSTNVEPVFRDGEETPYAVVAAYRDITEQRRQARELAGSQRQLALAVEGSDLSHWEWNLSEDRISYGPAWPEWLGYAADEIEPTSRAWAKLVHADDVPHMRGEVVGHVKGLTHRLEAEYRMRARDGSWRWIHTRGRVVERDASGRAVRISGTHADVTRRHEAEDRLREAQEKLLVATRLASVGTLAAGVAHEINNPLAWLSSNIAYALESLPADGRGDGRLPRLQDLREALGEALQGADRIASIVKAMRSLGRPSDAEEPQPIDVRAELQNALQMVRNQLVQRAHLEVHLPEQLPTVRARTNELGRVFLNVLVNAAQAIPEGNAAENRIAVTARETGGQIVVEVSDSGAGIPRRVRERVFEPFYTTKPVGEGTGLGLSIARSVIEGAGGSIEFESEEGKGTTFRIRVPARRADPPAAPAPERAAGNDGRAAAPRRVLVIDDEPLVRKALARALAKVHDVTALASASEALRRMDRGERWDVIFCDLMLPDVDGVGFYEALADRGSDAVSRLAFVTGGAFGERATRFLADHHVVALSKPVEAAELLAVAERLAGAPG